MLTFPHKGFNRSVTTHNVDVGNCCDWLEANSIFFDGDLSKSELVDLLCENEIYAEQDFAWELVSDVWINLRRRSRIFGCGYPLDVQPSRIIARGDWRAYSPYAFCLTLSLSNLYPVWARGFGPDSNEQGDIFEALTAAAFESTFAGWGVFRTGWSSSNVSNLKLIVEQIIKRISETSGNISKWTKPTANDAGLDLLCYFPFSDERGGIPIYMFQCASGANWESKLKTPDLRIWKKVIDFASDPKKAFAMPFALSDEEFIRNCNIVNGLFFDRYRLLAPGVSKRNWMTDDNLKTKMAKWIEERISALQEISVD